MRKESQNNLILSYLMEHDGITPLQAMDKFGCMRLASRIWDLKHRGVKIKTEYVYHKSEYGTIKFAKYSLG